MIYKSVIIAKLLYASSSSAWWGFTTATDRQHLEALIKRGIRSGLCGADVSSLAELADSVAGLFQCAVLHKNFSSKWICAVLKGSMCSSKMT